MFQPYIVVTHLLQLPTTPTHWPILPTLAPGASLPPPTTMEKKFTNMRAAGTASGQKLMGAGWLEHVVTLNHMTQGRMVTWGFQPHRIAHSRDCTHTVLHPRPLTCIGLHCNGLHPHLHGITPTQDGTKHELSGCTCIWINSKGIATAKNCTSQDYSPKRLHQHRIAPTGNVAQTGLHQLGINCTHRVVTAWYFTFFLEKLFS